jgi:hypothetical protein
MGDTGYDGETDIPGATKRRSIIESSYLGLTLTEYNALPASMKPKYGYLRWALDQPDNKEPPGVAGYGPDTWILENERIAQRTTFSLGDSLDRVRHNVPDAYQGDGRFRAFAAQRWDQTLIPYAERIVLAPELLPAFKKGYAAVPSGAKAEGFRRYLVENGYASLRKSTMPSTCATSGRSSLARILRRLTLRGHSTNAGSKSATRDNGPHASGSLSPTLSTPTDDRA